MADTSTPVRSRRLSSRIIVNGPRRRSPFRRPAIIVLELLGLLAFWHLAVVTFEWVNPLFYPPPGKVLGALGDLWEEGVLAKNIRFSVTVWGKGYLIGAVSGVAFGVLMGTSNATYRLGAPIVWSLWATPLIALRPMTAVWFGFGDRPIIFLVFLGTFFPIALNTAAGAREVDGSLIRSARVFGANRWEEFRKIRLPWTRPYIFAGMRLAIPTSIIALLIGELLGSSKGLGAMITLNTSRFRTDRTFAVILVLVLLMALVTSLIGPGDSLIRLSDFPVWLGIGLATVLVLAAYGALYNTLGLIAPKYGVYFCIILGIWEFIMGMFTMTMPSASVPMLSISHWALQLIDAIVLIAWPDTLQYTQIASAFGIDSGLPFFWQPPVHTLGTQSPVAALLVSITVLLLITVAMMGIGQASFKNREIM